MKDLFVQFPITIFKSHFKCSYMNWIKKLLGKNILQDTADIVDRFVETKEEKKEYFKEVYQMQIDEKNSARKLYSQDNTMQKVYAGTFLLGYLVLTGWLLFAIIGGSISEVNQFETGLIGSIWGGMSAKVNTITDFFFGSSDKK